MKKELLNRILSSIILFPLTIFIVIDGSFIFFIFLFLCFFISLYEWKRMKISYNLKILGAIFLVISFFTIYSMRLAFDGNYWPFMMIILICVLTDLGGYVFGKTFKGPKLTILSPNKTYAGMIGSFTLCLALCFIIFNLNLIEREYFVNLAVFIFIISSVSQLGDLFISYFKRLSNIKDTGNIIPGHGGLLDRIDGMIFAFPISYLILMIDYFKVLL